MAIHPLSSARSHARARWIGIPLFCLGALGLVSGSGLWLGGLVPGACVLLYIAATGLSLACFGTHNDTALGWMVRAGEENLDPVLQTELRAELALDRQGVSALSPSPKIAWVMTAIAVLLHLWAGARLFGALA